MSKTNTEARLFQHYNQQHEHNYEYSNGDPAPVPLALPRDIAQPRPGAIERALMSIHPTLDIRQELILFVQLVADRDAQNALPAYTLAERIEVLVLLAQDVFVVFVYDLVRQLALIGTRRLVGVPFLIREESRTVGHVDRVFLLLAWIVAEAHALVPSGLRRPALRRGEVFAQVGVVGLSRFGCGRRFTVELCVEFVVLLS